MRFIKNFEKFLESVEAADPIVDPGKTKTKPTVKPIKPGAPSPIRRDKPSVDPKPKAFTDKEKKLATFDDVAERFINLMKERGEDIKKFIDK
jgi:hypothetical protein